MSNEGVSHEGLKPQLQNPPEETIEEKARNIEFDNCNDSFNEENDDEDKFDKKISESDRKNDRYQEKDANVNEKSGDTNEKEGDNEEKEAIEENARKAAYDNCQNCHKFGICRACRAKRSCGLKASGHCPKYCSWCAG